MNRSVRLRKPSSSAIRSRILNSSFVMLRYAFCRIFPCMICVNAECRMQNAECRMQSVFHQYDDPGIFRDRFLLSFSRSFGNYIYF